MKLNITVIVQKPGKMRATINQFFTRRHEDEEVKLSRKIWAFLEKHNDCWDFASARSTFVFVREFWQMRIDLLVTSKL